MIRLHVPDALDSGARVTLGPEPTRYLLTVMRRRAGDELLLFNGRDGEWRARIAEAGKRAAVLEPQVRVRDQALGPDLDLLVALVKRSRLETIVEKAAELGARRVRLVLTRRTNADRANVERLRAIAAEAAEQTGRLDIPEILAAERLDSILDAWQRGRALVFCDEAGDALPMLEALDPPLRSGGGVGGADGGGPPSPDREPPPALRATSPAAQGRIAPAAILIGPEGGFDPAEREQLRALPFATPVSLGPRILRADTAAIAALTLWQAAAGDWRSCPATAAVPNEPRPVKLSGGQAPAA